MWLIFRWKKGFVNICRLLLFHQKELFKQIQIFLRICPFSNMLSETNFLSILVLLAEIVIFGLKREVLCEFPRKSIKTTQKHFFLIFVPFQWFDQKELFKQIQIFLRICPFSNMLRKTNLVSISVFLSEIVTFWSKKRSSLWISSKKCFKTIVKHSLAVYCSLWGEKNILF